MVKVRTKKKVFIFTALKATEAIVWVNLQREDAAAGVILEPCLLAL